MIKQITLPPIKDIDKFSVAMFQASPITINDVINLNNKLDIAGTPTTTAATQDEDDNSTNIATTEYVDRLLQFVQSQTILIPHTDNSTLINNTITIPNGAKRMDALCIGRGGKAGLPYVTSSVTRTGSSGGGGQAIATFNIYLGTTTSVEYSWVAQNVSTDPNHPDYNGLYLKISDGRGNLVKTNIAKNGRDGNDADANGVGSAVTSRPSKWAWNNGSRYRNDFYIGGGGAAGKEVTYITNNVSLIQPDYAGIPEELMRTAQGNHGVGQLYQASSGIGGGQGIIAEQGIWNASPRGSSAIEIIWYF